MDYQGGESIDLMISLFSELASDARSRGTLRDDFYFISDGALRTFKNFQAIPVDLAVPGARIEQAYLIWRQTPRSTLNLFARALGFELPQDFIQLGPFAVLEGGGER